jgi:transcriptional regulator with XRE-family HTH domain
MKRDEYEKQIIDNIRMYRQLKGLTQEELARRCNMPTGYIGGIETYKRFPKVKNLKRIAEALDIDIAYLMSPKLAEQVLEVSDAVKGLNEHVQSYLDKMIQNTSKNRNND